MTTVNDKTERWCAFVSSIWITFVLVLWPRKARGVSGVMVSIVAFQAVDRGSIPRWRTVLLSFWMRIRREQKNVSEVGFEPTPTSVDQNSLDQELITGTYPWVWRLRPLGHPDMLSKGWNDGCNSVIKFWSPKMLQVRFELTTSAFLAPFTAYKYGALTDCATGATYYFSIAIKTNLN